MRISLVADAERAIVQGFHEAFILRRFGCKPPPLPEFVLAAYEEEVPVGVVGCDFAPESRRFYLENLYIFDRSKTPLPFVREKIAEIGRWASEDSGLGPLLAEAVASFALTKGKLYGICDLKPAVARLSRELGMRLFAVDGKLDPLGIERLPPERRPYYEERPLPKMYMMDLAQVQRALRARITI